MGALVMVSGVVLNNNRRTSTRRISAVSRWSIHSRPWFYQCADSKAGADVQR